MRLTCKSLLAAALVTAACHGTPPAKSPASHTVPLSNHTAAPAARPAVSDLALLPADSDMVIGLNFAQLQKSALWQQYVAPKLAASTDLQEFHDICGFDPLQALQSVVVGGRWDGDEPSGTAVVHGESRSKTMGCLTKTGIAKAEQDGAKVAIDGDVVLVTDKSGTQLGLTFLDEQTALVVFGPDAATAATIEHIAAGTEGQTLDSSAAFHELYGKTNTHDSLWVLVNAQKPAFQRAASLGLHMKAIFGSVNVTDGLTVDAHLRTQSPDEANNFVTLMHSQLAQSPQIQQFVDKLEITASEADVNVAVTLSQQKLTMLAGVFAGALASALGPSPAAPPPPAP